MTKLDTIDRLAMYYRGFHHSCVTWYITVMGFFVAGLIASGSPLKQGACVAILFASTLLGLTFFGTVFHYGARIAVLDRYLSLPESEVPTDWRRLHKGAFIQVAGVGSFFFLAIILLMQIAVWWLALVPR